MFNRVLQLDAQGEPMALVEWDRACTLLWKGQAQMLAHDPSRIIRSQDWQTPAPLVIQLPRTRADYVKLAPETVGDHVVRSVLYARDNWQCQYCGIAVDDETASIDHVRPVWMFEAEGLDRAAATFWENVTTSCKRCNHIKGGLLPMECGMYPMTTPRRPSYVKLWANRRYHPLQAEYVAEWCKLDLDRLRVTRVASDFDWDRAWSERLEQLLRDASEG